VIVVSINCDKSFTISQFFGAPKKEGSGKKSNFVQWWKGGNHEIWLHFSKKNTANKIGGLMPYACLIWIEVA
jgi:hypothetical protein